MVKCLRCNYEWLPRVERPSNCPKCKIKNWDVIESSPSRIKTGRHGCTHHPMYHIWNSMMRRCLQPHHHAYKDYGGRGITVDLEWHDPNQFIADMGNTYRGGLTLDRIDNDKGYCKDNCRWSDRVIQANNKRGNKKITICGETKNLAEWLRQYGIKKPTYQKRRRKGWGVIESIITPIDQRYSRPFVR